jgi:diguanylate cyclase (GGDEF)-like protein
MFNFNHMNIFNRIYKAAPVFFMGGLIFTGILMAIQTAVYLVVQDEASLAVVNDISAVFSSLAATLGMAFGAACSYRLDRRLGNAWRLFALAMAMWTIGDLIWAFYDLNVGEVPYPSIADPFYLSTYVFFFIGILKYPRLYHVSPEAQNAEAADAEWIWLDIFIIIFSASGIFWNFLIGPALQDSQQSMFATLVNAAYPLGDLLLIASITLMIFLPRSPLWLRPMYLMLAGHTLSVIADGIFAFQTTNEVYTSGAFVNILFSAGPLVLMLSGLSQAAVVRQVAGGQKTMPLSTQTRSLIAIRLVTPFVWLFFAFFLLNFGSNSKQALSPVVLSIWLGVIIILIAARQMLSTLDNRRLASELWKINTMLEKHVEDRTVDLLHANTELRHEMEERKRIEMMLREREEKLTHFGLHDALTGLPNRSLLLDRLTHSIQRYHRHPDDTYAVLFLDFDSFKVVNDSLGHPAGDQLLVQIGQRLVSLFRAEDTVARLGGDEFVALIQGFDNPDLVTSIANRILNSMKEPFLLGRNSIYISVSIGMVIANSSYQTAIEIIRDADVAMYEAKMKGKGRFVLFKPDLQLNAINRQELDTDLRRALKYDEFMLYYQPIVSIETERICGFEALIRWQHPKRGLMYPSEFIPIAESNGFIDQITRWTLQHASLQLSRWQAEFPMALPLMISVNLSPISLRQPELFRWVSECLNMAALSPSSLALEIVETIFIQDPALAGHTFRNLRKLGVKVSLDDFGTGYSSLGYINEYPIDTIKIDRSFVSRLNETGEVSAIVRAVAQLAHDLNFQIIAEGIETREQFDFIKAVGCQYGQGYLFHKPLEKDKAEALLMEQGPDGK